MLTKYGVCYNLEESPFVVEQGDYALFFSTEKHMQKFMEKYPEYRTKISESLSTRFNLPVRAETLADISLYQKIETRGFYVEYMGEELCQIRI